MESSRTGPRTRFRTGAECRRGAGFTLMEVVLALAILATVLTLAYRMLVNVLETERAVARVSTPEKVGVAILSMVQKDLLGLVFRNLGESVFQVYDNGELPGARDEIQFFTTRNPISPESIGGQPDVGISDEFSMGFRSLTGVVYNLQENSGTSAAGVYTLFRHELTEWDDFDPFGSASGQRMAYEIYDKVRALSIECFDGREWWQDWESGIRLEEEALALEEGNDSSSGIVDRVAARVPGEEAGEDVLDDSMSPDLLPPAAVPVAVRVTVVILAGDEKGAYTDESGFGEFKEFTYSTLVPILPALRIPLSSDEDLAMLDEMEGNEGRDGDGDGDDGTDSDSRKTGNRAPTVQDLLRKGGGGR